MGPLCQEQQASGMLPISHQPAIYISPSSQQKLSCTGDIFLHLRMSASIFKHYKFSTKKCIQQIRGNIKNLALTKFLKRRFPSHPSDMHTSKINPSSETLKIAKPAIDKVENLKGRRGWIFAELSVLKY